MVFIFILFIFNGNLIKIHLKCNRRIYKQNAQGTRCKGLVSMAPAK